MLMLQDSAAYITNKGVSVIMIMATCIMVAAFMDAFVITPLENRCLQHHLHIYIREGKYFLFIQDNTIFRPAAS